MQQAAPASQGLGETDRPVLVVKAWTVGADDKPVPIMAGSLTEEQLRRDCQYLPDVQKWTDEAASTLAPHKSTVAPNVWGSLVHGAVKRTIDALKAAFPLVYANLQPELSLSDSSTEKVPYGQKYSTRLDVVEDRSFDMGAVCDYDIKTGRGRSYAHETEGDCRAPGLAIPWDENFHHRGPPGAMTTIAEVKRWTRPILAEHADLGLKPRKLYLRPVRHIHRYIHFLGSYDRALPKPTACFNILSVPPRGA